MIKVAIVEDDKDCISQLKEILERYQKEFSVEFKISVFLNGINFISDYTAEFDLVFMDIEMPHMNGLKAAKLMRKMDSQVSLVFVTNLAKYAIKGYEVDACNFIVKPIEYESFCAKLSKEIERIKKRDNPYLFIDSRDGKRKVYYSDIYYLTVSGRYVMLHTKTGIVEIHKSMKDIEKMLAGSNFVRGDNSSMVNLMYVTEINAEGAIVNGELIPCSRNRRKALLDAFTLYLN